MRHRWMVRVLACLSLWLGGAGCSDAHEIVLDTSAAEATLAALGDPGLTETEARRIVKLPANQALVRKMLRYGPIPDEERMIAELLASAHGQTMPDMSWYRFDEVRDHREAVLRTVAAFKADPAGIAAWVDHRIQTFSPPGPPQRLAGFLIAGGRPTGFTLGGADFYLNIGRFPGEPGTARLILAHELYHAVQSAALKALGRSQEEVDDEHLAALPSRAARNVAMVRAYFDNLMNEGLATYVGDSMLLPVEGDYSRGTRDQLIGQLRRPELLSGLLDVALVSVTSDPGVPYEEAYGVGFYGWASPMYSLGYQMAKAIAEKRGDHRLGELSVGSGCEFAREYVALTKTDPKMPPLGEQTLRLMATSC